MKLYHATPRRNLGSIMTRGLLTAKSRGNLAAVWMAAGSKSPWAILHVIKRHAVRAESVALLEVDVPRGWLRKSKKGLWYCRTDIPAERIKKVTGFLKLADTARVG